MEQGDLDVPWKRSIRWKWHALRSGEIIKSPLDFTFAGSLDTSNVAYSLDDGVAMWRVFDTSGNFMLEKKYPTMNVYARNMRDSKVVLRLSPLEVQDKVVRFVLCEHSSSSSFKKDSLVYRLDSKSDAKCLFRVALIKSGTTATSLRSIKISWNIQEVI